MRKRIVVDSYEKVQTYNFMRYVPNRILRPFFVRETKGMPDYLVDQKISELAAKQFLERCPLFCFDEPRERIFTGLHIEQLGDLLDRGELKSAYHETLNPLMSTAKRQGFQSEWTYQGLYL